MQKVIRQYNNINPIFDDIDKLYTFTSEKKRTGLIPLMLPDVFKPLLSLFEEYCYTNYQVTYKKVNYGKIKAFGNKNMIVCFSGGKDSIATVKYYMEHGYNVYLYHMKHINPPLYDEVDAAKELSEYWNIPLFVDSVKLSGKHDYVEHPMKNMIIASGALQYGIREGIGTNIAFGNYTTSSLDYDNFEFCGGDDIEMWDVFNKIIRCVIPRFKMHVVLDNLGQTLTTVCQDSDLMEMSVSCLGRASMRVYWHDWVYNKFGVQLPKHRCGRCYKCCIEYIYMADHDLQTYNADYYRYCFNNLKKNVQREDGIKYTDNEVWEHYFFYDIEKSKLFTES